MPRLLTVSLIALLTLMLVLPASAKKHRPTTTTAPTTQPAPGKKGSESAVETHKRRAKEYEGGKELDKGKTEGKVGSLTDQVNALDKKVKEQAEAPAKSSKHKKHHPTTQPTTQESPKSEKSKK
jgi:hypothetical protein